MLKSTFPIDDLIKSAGRFSLALSLLGLQHLWNASSIVCESQGSHCRELQNKITAFALFEFADVVLNNPPEAPLSLPRLVSAAEQLGPFYSVWATEGAGHSYAGRHLAADERPRGLMAHLDPAQIPPASVLPLNTGLGLALAEHVLAIANHKQRADWALLSQFIELCRNNCTAGYEGAGFEALGLAARTLHPHLIAAIDSVLASQCPGLLGYFWHGVGRAIYFSPTHSLPFCHQPWPGLDTCFHEPPHLLGKQNSLAGFTWAVTLVNIRHPAIVAEFLSQCRQQLLQSEPFVNGLCSALLIWRRAQMDQRRLQAFLRYRPASSDPELCRLWTSQVVQPAAQVLQAYPLRDRGLGSLFTYQTLAALIESAGESWPPAVTTAGSNAVGSHSRSVRVN